MAINTTQFTSAAETMIRCSKLSENQLKRLTGEERILIAKMSRLFESNDRKYLPKPGEINKLTTHLDRIEQKDKKVFFITAIFRDFVQSINCTLADLNSGKKSAQDFIASQLYLRLSHLIEDQIKDNNNYKQLKDAALSGDGYAISYLKTLFDIKVIEEDQEVIITKLYQEALANNHPAIVESEMFYWTRVPDETFKSDFTEQKLLQMFEYIPQSKLNTNSETNKTMARLCQRVKTMDATVLYKQKTLDLINNFQKSYGTS